MFIAFIGKDIPIEDKSKALETICDGFEYSKEEIVSLLSKQLKTPSPKEKFTEEIRQIFESYQICKIDEKHPFLSSAEEIGNLTLDSQYVSIFLICFKIYVIIAEQIRLRNYDLNYTTKVTEKAPIYIKIYEKRYGLIENKIKTLISILLTMTINLNNLKRYGFTDIMCATAMFIPHIIVSL